MCVCVFEITFGKSTLIMSSLSTVGLENMLIFDAKRKDYRDKM